MEYDRLIGENVKFIADEVEQLGYSKKDIILFNDKNELLNYLLNNLRKGDVVLFKASNGMRLFEVADELINKIN